LDNFAEPMAIRFKDRWRRRYQGRNRRLKALSRFEFASSSSVRYEPLFAFLQSLLGSFC
jgi:hypothetical protein